MQIAKSIGMWLAANWERLLFVLVGLAFLGTSFYLIYVEKITEAAVVFGLGFLSFLYANVARFKRFKGLGFEAELWEDKQKEAADLIERLREVVSIYTREVIIGKVKAGRIGAPDWVERWKLYDDLVTQHDVLGQKIDFTGVKKVMDDYFLFDMAMPEISKIREATINGMAAARASIDQEFGSPVRDPDGYNRRWLQFSEIKEKIEDPFEISAKADLAKHALAMWRDTEMRLKRDFDIDAEVDQKVIERLEAISTLYRSRPVKVTDELVSWANRED